MDIEVERHSFIHGGKLNKLNKQIKKKLALDYRSNLQGYENNSKLKDQMYIFHLSVGSPTGL